MASKPAVKRAKGRRRKLARAALERLLADLNFGEWVDLIWAGVVYSRTPAIEALQYDEARDLAAIILERLADVTAGTEGVSPA
jgi:hypothetical protein